MSAARIKDWPDLETLKSTHVGIEFPLPIMDLEFACGELMLKGEPIQTGKARSLRQCNPGILEECQCKRQTQVSLGEVSGKNDVIAQC
jgi:hypothetical protein